MISTSLQSLQYDGSRDKSVARSFSNAAQQYDEHAHIQKQSAVDLFASFSDELSVSNRILDVGCGTGILSSLSSNHASNHNNAWFNLDISRRMLAQCQQKKTRQGQFEICADANNLPFSGKSFDLVVSNMALQWCEAPNRCLSEIYRVLEKDGVAHLSIIVDESFASLKDAWRQTGYIPKLAQLPSQAEWLKSANTHFSVSAKTTLYVDEAKSTNDLLKRINRVGAGINGKSNARFSVAESRALEVAWQRLFGSVYRLEYQVLQLQLAKM